MRCVSYDQPFAEDVKKRLPEYQKMQDVARSTRILSSKKCKHEKAQDAEKASRSSAPGPPGTSGSGTGTGPGPEANYNLRRSNRAQVPMKFIANGTIRCSADDTSCSDTDSSPSSSEDGSDSDYGAVFENWRKGKGVIRVS